MKKKELRREVLVRRDAMSQQVCIEKSGMIADKVIRMPEFQKSNKILLYAPIRNEVETKEIREEAKCLKKEIFYPRVLGKEMKFYRVGESTEFETSPYGICEPKPELAELFVPEKEDMIFVLVPGVVFDEAGSRIGYGGGYYDKYLQWLEEEISVDNICKVAIAYDCQLVEEGRIKKETHDVAMDFIVTETRLLSMEARNGKFI